MAGFGSNAPSYRDDYEEDYDQGGYEPQPRVAQRPRNVPNQIYGVPQYQPMRPGPLAQQTTRTLGGQGTAPRQMMPPSPMQTMPVRTQQPMRRSQQALRAPTMQPQRQSRFGEFMTGLNIGRNGFKMGLMLIGAIVGLLAVYFLVSNVVRWWQTWQDDMAYGRPRTVQIDQFVGHGEEDGTASHFIVQNNNRQITVIEYPGGDVTKTRVIPGPRLFGKDMELAPVKPRFQDVNGDGHVDMILSVDNEEFVYINEKSNFRPITPEERNRYSKMSGGNK